MGLSFLLFCNPVLTFLSLITQTNDVNGLSLPTCAVILELTHHIHSVSDHQCNNSLPILKKKRFS